MSLMQTRGGIPHVFRASVDQAAGRKHRLPHYSSFLIIRAQTAACRLYFTKADFDADQNFVLVPIPSASTPHGEWAGPVEASDVFLRSDNAGTPTDVELVTFQRRA